MPSSIKTPNVTRTRMLVLETYEILQNQQAVHRLKYRGVHRNLSIPLIHNSLLTGREYYGDEVQLLCVMPTTLLFWPVMRIHINACGTRSTEVALLNANAGVGSPQSTLCSENKAKRSNLASIRIWIRE